MLFQNLDILLSERVYPISQDGLVAFDIGGEVRRPSLLKDHSFESSSA